MGGGRHDGASSKSVNSEIIPKTTDYYRWTQRQWLAACTVTLTPPRRRGGLRRSQPGNSRRRCRRTQLPATCFALRQCGQRSTDIVAGDEPAPAQQVEGGRVGVREQCGERQFASCSAELLRGLDGGVGLHCGTRHRGVPGRGSDCSWAGRATAHGAVGGGRAVGRATGGSGTPRTSPDPGVQHSRRRYRGGRHRRRPRWPKC
jgi:hypothetical protein